MSNYPLYSSVIHLAWKGSIHYCITACRDPVGLNFKFFRSCWKSKTSLLRRLGEIKNSIDSNQLKKVAIESGEPHQPQNSFHPSILHFFGGKNAKVGKNYLVRLEVGIPSQVRPFQVRLKSHLHCSNYCVAQHNIIET